MRCFAIRASERPSMRLGERPVCTVDRNVRPPSLSGCPAMPDAAIATPWAGGLVGGESLGGRSEVRGRSHGDAVRQNSRTVSRPHRSHRLPCRSEREAPMLAATLPTLVGAIPHPKTTTIMEFPESELQNVIHNHVSCFPGCSFGEIRSDAVARLSRKANLAHQARVALLRDPDFERRVKVATYLLMYEGKIKESADEYRCA